MAIFKLKQTLNRKLQFQSTAKKKINKKRSKVKSVLCLTKITTIVYY